MAIVKWDPFRDMMTLRERMDRLFEDSLSRIRGEGEEPSFGAWTPAVDIYETADSLVIKAELPGLEKENINIEVKNNSLSLSGERRYEKEIKEENYHRMERSYGHFRRVFTLPATVDQENIKASFKNGVLEVALPKVEKAKPKQIKINVD